MRAVIDRVNELSGEDIRLLEKEFTMKKKASLGTGSE
jgi:hypothetical protein